ncbi:MAG: DUF6273 domain-containing protein, partial [Oscillospiraceae bacterium]|nr:DUF6273 domain-containing protein [Oscillospiraceae bacterium]
KIFLLSLEEAVKYFGDSGQLENRPWDDAYNITDEYNGARVARTARAVPGHESIYPAGTAWFWWLRSPGDGTDYAALVYYDGAVTVNGGRVNVSEVGLRPAMWITP